MSEITTYRGTVYPWHCDHMGHMNVMWYVGKFDEAAWNLLVEIGLTPSYLREHNRGFAVVWMSVEYQQELHAGDVLEVRSTITGVGEKALAVSQTMINGEGRGTAARWEAVAVYLDRQTRKAVPLPESVLNAARAKFPDVRTLHSRSGDFARPPAGVELAA